jgi:hypothetical protein
MFIESFARTSLRYVHGGVLTIFRPQLPTKQGWPSIVVVAFIIVPAATHSYTIEALKGQAVSHQTAPRYRHRDPKQDWLFYHAARFHGSVPVVTHSLVLMFPQRPQGHLNTRRAPLGRRPSPPQTLHLRAQARLTSPDHDTQHGRQRERS